MQHLRDWFERKAENTLIRVCSDVRRYWSGIVILEFEIRLLVMFFRTENGYQHKRTLLFWHIFPDRKHNNIRLLLLLAVIYCTWNSIPLKTYNCVQDKYFHVLTGWKILCCFKQHAFITGLFFLCLWSTVISQFYNYLEWVRSCGTSVYAYY